MLETVRQYARDKLRDASEETKTCRRHRDWYVRLADQADAGLRGPSQDEWLNRLETEHDNLRTALAWSSSEDGGAELELRLVGALFWFWWCRGHWSEAQRWLEGALGRSEEAPPSALPRVLLGLCHLAMLRGNLDRADAILKRCLALSRECGDDLVAALALLRLATNAQKMGDADAATMLHEEAIAATRNLGNPWVAMLARGHAGLLAWHKADYDRSRVFFEESLAMSRTIGDKYYIGYFLRHLGLVALHRQEYARAADFFAEGLALCREVGDRWNIEGCVEGARQVACARGQHTEAARLFGAAEVLCDTLGFHRAPLDQALHQRCVIATRTWLGDSAFEAAWVEGRRMSLDEAIAHALAQIRTAAETLKARATRTAEPHPGLLTAREREVALLIARGMTNHEIALRLFIAERTVDAHVRHILDKLGARSRAQVAAWVGGQGLRRTPIA
jgi:non-specific serine/threonine protein kinase